MPHTTPRRSRAHKDQHSIALTLEDVTQVACVVARLVSLVVALVAVTVVAASVRARAV